MCLPDFKYPAGGRITTTFTFLNLFMWLHQVLIAACGLHCPADLSSPNRGELMFPALQGRLTATGPPSPHDYL